MLPVNVGGHTAYQNTFVSEFLKLYPNPYVSVLLVLIAAANVSFLSLTVAGLGFLQR